MHGRAGFIISLALSGGLLFLLIWYPPCLSLTLPHLSEINPDCTASERICLWRASVLFVSSSEPPNEGIEAAPGLPKRAGARCRWLRLSKKHTPLKVNFCFPKLVKIPKKLQDMVGVALGEWNWGPLILQVLPEGVPVPSLLRLIAAWCGWLLMGVRIGGRA